MQQQLPFLVCFVFFVTFVLAATMPCTPQRQPAPGKESYIIFPRAGSDASDAANFIKATVSAGDLLPWTDVQENLISWTVEASGGEVARLQAHAGIDQVTKLELPPQPAKDARATMDTTAQDVDTELLGRRPDAGHYHVFPRDGTDRKQCNETEAFPISIPEGHQATADAP